MRLEPDLDVARRFVAASALPGRLVLGGITGSHHYGFPSPDSDLDIKAIHLAPTETVLGLAPPKESFERLEVFEDVECDLTSNEARQALQLFLRALAGRILGQRTRVALERHVVVVERHLIELGDAVQELDATLGRAGVRGLNLVHADQLPHLTGVAVERLEDLGDQQLMIGHLKQALHVRERVRIVR